MEGSAKTDKWPAEEQIEKMSNNSACTWRTASQRVFLDKSPEVVDEENNIVPHCATADHTNCYSNGCVALAMHYNSNLVRGNRVDRDPDTERLHLLLHYTRLDGVLSLSEYGLRNDEYSPGLLSCNFKEAMPCELFTVQNIRVVLMDYFWVPADYYHSNYGTNWASRKVPAIFENMSSVQHVILPHAKGVAPPETSLRWQCETYPPPDGITRFNMSVDDSRSMHPLVYVSNLWSQDHNNQQLDNYTLYFAVWSRMSEADARGDLKSLCSDPPVKPLDDGEPRVRLRLSGVRA